MKTNVITLTTQEYKNLIDTDNSLRTEIGNLKGTIGELREALTNARKELKAKNEALKDKQPIIERVITKKRDRWGDSYTVSQIDNTIGLEDVKRELRKELDLQITDEAANAKKTITDLKGEILELKLANKEISDQLTVKEQEIENKVAKKYEKRFEKVEEDYSDKLHKYKRQIKELERELDKVTNDKTNRDLAKAREEQLRLKQEEIDNLESELAIVNNTNWFTRFVTTRAANRNKRMTRRERRALRNRMSELQREVEVLQGELSNRMQFTYGTNSNVYYL